VVRAALGQIERHFDEIWVSIPVSGETLESDALRQTLEPALAQRVVLQLTQQAPFDGGTAVERSLLEYRERGFRLSLTDAWAEVASLRHLVHLRPDFVRIDRELTRDVADDQGKQAVLRTLALVASDLGAVLVAEDVTSEEHAKVLGDLGVQLGCGAVKDVVDVRD
jgi:EAL domain-containing protein (putative c-di-GMP-specific phosphodiesterase class I)